MSASGPLDIETVRLALREISKLGDKQAEKLEHLDILQEFNVSRAQENTSKLKINDVKAIQELRGNALFDVFQHLINTPNLTYGLSEPSKHALVEAINNISSTKPVDLQGGVQNLLAFFDEHLTDENSPNNNALEILYNTIHISNLFLIANGWQLNKTDTDALAKVFASKCFDYFKNNFPSLNDEKLHALLSIAVKQDFSETFGERFAHKLAPAKLQALENILPASLKAQKEISDLTSKIEKNTNQLKQYEKALQEATKNKNIDPKLVNVLKENIQLVTQLIEGLKKAAPSLETKAKGLQQYEEKAAQSGDYFGVPHEPRSRLPMKSRYIAAGDPAKGATPTSSSSTTGVPPRRTDKRKPT